MLHRVTSDLNVDSWDLKSQDDRQVSVPDSFLIPRWGQLLERLSAQVRRATVSGFCLCPHPAEPAASETSWIIFLLPLVSGRIGSMSSWEASRWILFLWLVGLEMNPRLGTAQSAQSSLGESRQRLHHDFAPSPSLGHSRQRLHP